ncbi:sugar phosphate isomerase/epimerase, partial [Candidatus Poribacteria bacterium]|nr:sugar phosphate isomerase/epimerase [Candidatus Poribacteria bacterium]
MASEPKPDDAHSLKIGFQTILWGPRLPSVEHVLHILTQAGFQGVEFAQRPKYLGSIDDLLRTAERIGMRLLGLAGGTIRERVEFCKDYKDLYLYVEEWNEKEATYAIEHGFTLALHPHMFKPVQRLEEAYACLDQHSALRFLPDTAHLHIAGDNCAEAVRGRYKDLAAVHIKDWKPDYGRSSHRYAHGFTELGKGEVEPTIAEVLDLLCEKKYDGWVIAEQDWSSSTPEDSVFACASWLHENGYLGCKPEMPETRASRPVPVLGDAGKAYQFAKALKWASTLDQASCYDAIATAFHDICRCKMVTVWTCTPAQDLISLVSLKTDPTVPMPERVLPLDRCTLRCRDIPAGEAIAELDIKSFDLTDSTV